MHRKRARTSFARARSRQQPKPFNRPGAPIYVECLEQRQLLSGTWTQLTHNAPGGVGTMLLLPDGSVLAQINGTSADWARLTPDASGSYLRGTWSRLASMHDTRLYDSSQVLQSGSVFVAGGEYGSGGKTGEVYDPLTNTWISLPSQRFGGFSDSLSEMLPNGNVLIAPVAPAPSGYTVIFNPSTNTWSLGAKLYRGGNASEQSWLKLADGSVLSVDGANTSERYIPSLNRWVSDGAVPVDLFDQNHELGGGFLLADGRALFLGASGHTALYTQSGTSAPGTWAAGPSIPSGQGTPDAPAAMLPDGTVLLAVGPAGTLKGPTTFYVYDPATNIFSFGSGAPNLSGAPFGDRMLDLPDGTVLFTDGGSTLYDYDPQATPLADGTPTITGIQSNGDGTYQLTGTLLNGISEGAAYGDDAQMSSNYPLVRFSDGAGAVYYARTFNWSSTGVASGTASQTTEYVLPLGIPAGDYSVSVVANGIASSPMTVSIPTIANDAAPTVVTAAAASPSPVTGTTTGLSVLGDDDAGESNLTYTWTTTAVPFGAMLPSFSINGTNAAKQTTATFYRAGVYSFQVTITDSGGLSTASSVSVVVDQTRTSVTINPSTATLSAGHRQQFTAKVLDQFRQPMAIQPAAFTWAVASGGGTIGAAGLYTAPAAGTLATITANDGALQGTASVGVVSAPWASQDVGPVAIPGLAYDSSGAFTVSGSGSDIWGTSDQFRFVYQPVSGNVSTTARVVSEQNTDPFAKIGVMIRNSLDPTDAFAFMDVTPGNGTAFQYRTTKGGMAANNNTAAVATPYWVRLVRSGNTITGYRSTNGVAWSRQASITIAMGTNVYVGLNVCSHNNNALNTAVIDNVTVSQPAVAVAASADPNPVTGTTTSLSVLGADPAGESALTYTWAATTVPQGAAAPSFSVNRANAAKNTVATFSAAGAYTFTVTIADSAGLSVTSAVNVTVEQASVASVSLAFGAAGPVPLQDAADGLRLLPAGRTTDLPFVGISQLAITLNQAAVLSAGDVSVTGITVANYGPVTISGSGTSYTITLVQPIAAADRVTVTIGNGFIASFTRRLDVLPGDVNDDGMVDFNDLVVLARNFNQLNATPSQGDLTGDGIVNFDDLVALARGFGQLLPATT